MSEARRIVITGVSRGIGLAMAIEFLARGHRVFGCARSHILIDDELSADRGCFRLVDVSDAGQVATWAGMVLEQLGPPDLLINNAGVINQTAPLWQISADDFSEVMAINVNGVFHVLRNFVPAMVARGRGVIVNISSGWGRSTSPRVAPYCASKWAIEGLTRALADELPHGMAAIPLNPGIIHTELLDRCFGDSASAYPLPAQWAKRAVPFLLELGPEDNGDPLTAPK